MKALCVAVLASLVLATGAAAEENSVSVRQSQREDGKYLIDLTISYVFPGLPPRQKNSGVGFVRVNLPGTDIAPNPIGGADAGYMCFTEGQGIVTCSSEGQQTGDGGTAFPVTMAMHLISTNCWDPNSAPGPGAATVWAAPNDTGGDPDVTLPVDGGGCNGDAPQQPVLPDKPLKCTVPNLKNVSLVSAKRRLANAKCATGRIRYVASKLRKGKVVSQSVKAGRILKSGAKVNLLVSKGPTTA